MSLNQDQAPTSFLTEQERRYHANFAAWLRKRVEKALEDDFRQDLHPKLLALAREEEAKAAS